MSDLTLREVEVAELVATGMSNAGIAKALGITPSTVEDYLDRIYLKLQIGRNPLVNRRVMLARRQLLARSSHDR